MNKEQRLEYLTKLSKKDPYAWMEVYYKNRRQKLPVFEIDLNYLIYNPYNGRIASRVKSYETQGGKTLDPTNEDDIATIESFLEESSKLSNKNTYESISKQGQLKYGIVTKDGVIIDGNRRAMLLRRVARDKKEKPVYFLGVILEEALDENPKEIMRLETTFQMGEDAKVDYDPIEKYLKCKDLIQYYPGDEGIKEIAKMMGEKPPKIKEYLSIMERMDDYLGKLGYSGIYTRLSKTEGAFVDINSYLNRYESGDSGMVKWKYKKSDVEELKLIYYDYIQYMYNKKKKKDDEEDGGVFSGGDSKDYRIIGKASQKESFFCANEKIWKEFKNNHFKEVDPIKEEFENGKFSVEQMRKDHDGMNLNDLLKRRDEAWADMVGPILKKNLGRTKYNLENLNNQNAPEELLEKALRTLETIDTNAKPFLEKPEVEQLVSDLNKKTYEFKQIIKNYKRG